MATGIWIISLHEWTNNYITQICRIPPSSSRPVTSVKNMFTEIFWYETRSINTHHQQHWPCEDLRLSRVIQQNNRAGNRWSLFNIRMKIIKMFTMEINILLWENQYLEEEQNSNGQSWRYCCREPVVRLNSLEHSLGTDCNWSSIITESRTSALNLKYSLQFNISFCPRLSHSLSLFVLIKFLC